MQDLENAFLEALRTHQVTILNKEWGWKTVLCKCAILMYCARQWLTCIHVKCILMGNFIFIALFCTKMILHYVV